MPKVLNMKTDQIPPDAIYCGRPSKWGNPFKIGMIYQGRKLTRVDAVEAHRDWFLYSDEGIKLQQNLPKLRGHDLVGWCAPLPCHIDVLLELANK
ncbi:unnamed protein product [marine sediment metagenome]|uniref:DUF4326 domain-containing protein n=1 Tax=marine sediment metagenome TaxID=412755 RepID=X1CX07_9ZZZZ